MSQKLRANHRIRANKLVVIDENGEMAGTLSLQEALKLAGERGLDLVEVNPAADPPVAKILDYGKFAYEQKKKDQRAKSKQKAHERKSIRIGFRTSDHDLATKARKVSEFIKKGHPVQISIFLRGRERAHQDMARERFESFVEIITEEHKVIEGIKKIPTGYVATLAPK